MPTPFQHLAYAKTLLDNSALAEDIRAPLQDELGAFLLGSIAVDVQAVTGQPRRSTHYYHMHSPSHNRAGPALLNAHATLANPHALDAAHAAFISGYLVHLSYDEVWLWDVFRPFYMESNLWSDRLTRSVHHNALRVMLDRRAEDQLRNENALVPALDSAIPHNWLPFVSDTAIRQWRDWILEQLADPERVQTVAVFAERMGITVAELERVVQRVTLGTYDPPIPGLYAALQRFEDEACTDAAQALCEYWG